MSERFFRLVLGGALWAILLYGSYTGDWLLLFVLMGILAFESITNWRIPVIVTRLRYGRSYKQYLPQSCGQNKHWWNSLEAERTLRLIVLLLLYLPFVFLPDITWFIPWFAAGMLILAGITNICPMVMFLRWAGFR